MTAAGRSSASEDSADSDLVAAIVAGELAALGAAYRRYGALAYSLARRIAADGPAAEGAVEAAFLDLWRSASTHSPAASLRDRLLGLVAREALARAARPIRPRLDARASGAPIAGRA